MPNTPKFRTPYDSDYNPANYGIKTGSETLVQQNLKDGCDINKIMARYNKTGVLEHITTARGSYNELPTPESYQDALNQLQAATDAFYELPSRVRKDFNNNPDEFLHFMHQPESEQRKCWLVGRIIASA